MFGYSLEASRRDTSNEYHNICIREMRAIDNIWLKKGS